MAVNRQRLAVKRRRLRRYPPATRSESRAYDEIDAALQHAFEQLFHIHVRIERRGTIELDEQVYVAIGRASSRVTEPERDISARRLKMGSGC
jgi:hypothetical protein